MGKLAELLAHPDEFLPLVRMYFLAKQAKKLPKDPNSAFCYGILNAVSRSFSVVINQLPTELRDAVCVFYLVLRALDTVEDDMGIPVEEKLPILREFYLRIKDPTFTLDYGTEHYQRLLQQFPKVNSVMLSLQPQQQEVIYDVTKQMGEGMADFIVKEVESVEDYDLYCYYVAGLVGVGLSKLLAVANLESEKLAIETDLSRHMGLFLQKTNIVRDYLEDINEEPAPRMFWPREIWGLYAQELEDFKSPVHRKDAVKCLNHLIVNLMQHIPYCFKYLEMLRTKDVFRFCAIPQVMAVATAALCFDNGAVYEGVVKLRRGETCKVFQDLQSMPDVYRMFLASLAKIQAKIPHAEMETEVRQKALKVVQETNALCREGLKNAPPPSSFTPQSVVLLLVLFLFLGLLFYTLDKPETGKLLHSEF